MNWRANDEAKRQELMTQLKTMDAKRQGELERVYRFVGTLSDLDHCEKEAFKRVLIEYASAWRELLLPFDLSEVIPEPTPKEKP